MKFALSRSQEILSGAFLWGAISAGLFYWFWPHALWWAYLVVGLLASALFHKAMLEVRAHQRIIDRPSDR
jgi:hypothetical protein